MEITERLPLKPIHWLSQLSYSEFVEKCLNKDKKHTKEECKTKYSILQNFCQTNLKTNGITKRIYSYSTEVSGRLLNTVDNLFVDSQFNFEASVFCFCDTFSLIWSVSRA